MNTDTRPEGEPWRKVRMSDTLFLLLGASGVDWGEPDTEGFYTPTVRAAEAVVRVSYETPPQQGDS